MTKSPTKNNHPILSIVILSYNSQDYLPKCLESIDKSKTQYSFEIIATDCASTDGSFELTKKCHLKNKLILKQLGQNYGYTKGNNLSLQYTDPSSKYVLFLNADTIIEPNTIENLVNFLETNPNVDAATGDLILVSKNETQIECHRGFPTPWNAFWHFFGFGLPRLFPKSKLLNGYSMSYLDYSKPQPIDACTGACLIIKRKVGEKLGWLNEKYFFYGDDLDLGWRLKKNGYKLFFYPGAKVYHYQGISSGIKSHSTHKSTNSRQNKILIAKATTDAMRIFYQENLINNYSLFWQFIVWRGIDLLEFYRVFKAKYL